MSNANSTKRFSNRVEDYVRYRPRYPVALVKFLEDQYDLSPVMQLADIGSGTGISSELFVQQGYHVFGVEPNKEMREKSVELLQQFPNFKAIDGTAEHTTLDDKSVDAIIAGQAFHWFNVVETKAEFARILKPNGIVALIWNERLIVSAFEQDYDKLIIRHGKDYVKHDHRNIDRDSINKFFAPQPCELKTFANYQVFDFEGLKGRLLSSSYMPTANDNGYAEMIADLKTLFDKYKENDQIKIDYTTKVYVSRLS